jgi:FkbM family methyltransferase
MQPKERVKRLLHRAGIHVMPYRFTGRARRQQLLRFYGVTDLLDVGANRGQYATDARLSGYRGRIWSYEPLAGPFSELASAAATDPGWHVERVAVGGEVGELVLHVSERDIYSSALSILDRATSTDPTSRSVSKETAPMRPLDDLAADIDGTLAVKIDVQGFEHAVLDGAPATMQRAAFLEMELSFVPLYEGQTLIEESLRRADELGFRLAMAEPLFPDHASGAALQMNGMFVRR